MQIVLGAWGMIHETINFEGQEVKGQGHTRPKIDMEAWQRHNTWSPWVE